MSRISAGYGSGALRVVILLTAGALAVGCGGASRQYPASAPESAAPPPAASSDAEASKAGAYPQPSQQAPAPAGAPMAPPAPATVSPTAPRDESEAAAPSAPSRSRAQQGESELEAAERGVASSDCPTACRALGSMERAVVFLCASSADDGDARHCGSAKGRLVSARRRVRTTCGECPSGPSVDPDAPVPSRR